MVLPATARVAVLIQTNRFRGVSPMDFPIATAVAPRRRTVWPWLAAGILGAALLVCVTGTAHAQSQPTTCAAGASCSITFDNTVYSVIGPCDLSSISTVYSGC